MTYHVFDLLRLTPHRDAGGAELPADVCARGREGLSPVSRAVRTAA
jgi:hypothetical protein